MDRDTWERTNACRAEKALGNDCDILNPWALIFPEEEEELTFDGVIVDITQLVLDIVGIVDPTGVADVGSATISVSRGEYFQAAISTVSVWPYIGDLAKGAKIPKWLTTIKNVVKLCDGSPKYIVKFRKPMEEVYKALSLFPDGCLTKLDELKALVREFLENSGGVPHLDPVDIGDTYHYSSGIETVIRSNGQKAERMVKEVAGRLGHPDKVARLRDVIAQRAMTSPLGKWIGDHAGHLVANVFGALGDFLNLSPQNWLSNVSSWKILENSWRRLVEGGTGVLVRVRDYHKIVDGVPDPRPYKRVAEYWTLDMAGNMSKPILREFGNFTTEVSRRLGGDAGTWWDEAYSASTSTREYVEKIPSLIEDFIASVDQWVDEMDTIVKELVEDIDIYK